MKTKTLRFGSPQDITPRGKDGVIIRFPFTAVDTVLVGAPEESHRTTNHRLRVEVTQWVTPVWEMEQNKDLVKVIFEIVKRQLREDLSNGAQLKDEFKFKIDTKTHSCQLPFDPNRLPWPDGLTVEVEISEPLGFHHAS